jgi:DinB superfamily
MNPYASYLGQQDPLPVIASSASKIESLIAAIGKQRAEEPPAPGKWCAREIVCHLADCETVFAFRLRQTLAQDHHVIQPFDQEKWAEQYRSYDLAQALALFSAARSWNVALIRSLPTAALSKTVTHPERGSMTFQVVVETMAGHDLNHIRQIEAIAARSAQA